MLNKKIIAKLLVFTMILSMLPFSAFAADGNAAAGKAGEQPNSSAYALISDTGVTVTGGKEGETPLTLTKQGGDGTTADTAYKMSADAEASVTATPDNTVTVEFSVVGSAVSVYHVGNDAVNLLEGTNATETLTIDFGEAETKDVNEKYVVWSTDGNAAYYDLSFTALLNTAPAYNVTVSETQNGNVTSSAKTQNEGMDVILTVTPDEGYELDTLTVDGENVTAELQEDGTYTYTFKMPAKDVVVSATFKEKTPESTEYTITVNAQPAEGGTAEPNVKTASAGTEITLTVTPNDGYELEGIVAATESGEPVTVTDGKFTMPADNVTVTVTFKAKADEPVEPDKKPTIELDTTETKILVGGNVTLNATTTNSTSAVKWTSDNSEVATVDDNGVVTGVKEGTATITATVTNEVGEATATCKITVESANIGDAEIVETKSEPVAGTGETPEEQTAINEAVGAIGNAPIAENLGAVVKTLGVPTNDGGVKINNVTVSKDSIKKVAETLEGYDADDPESYTTIIVPQVSITVAKAEMSGTVATSMSFDITVSAVVKVQTAKAEDVVETIPLNNTTENIQISIPLVSDFLESLSNAPVVKHVKKNPDKTFWHKASKTKSGVSFTNGHGFSEFTIYRSAEDSDAAAVIGETPYTTLQDAVDAVKDGDTIKVLKDGQSATVKTVVTFKVELADGVKDVNITAGSGYELKKADDGTYTVTKATTGTGKPSGGGGGGGSSKPSITSTGTKDPTDPVTPGSTGTDTGFGDVAPTAWYAESVKYVVDRGLFGGVGGGKFAPESNMTRAMMWTVLARYKGVNTDTGATWYEAARTWAIEQNISDGTMADGNVTREQFVTMLWRLSGEPAATGAASFTDNGSVSAYAKTAVDWAVSLGIVNGYSDGSFKPQGSATRAEVAKMLTVFCITTEG